MPAHRPPTPLQAAKHAFRGLTGRQRKVAALIAQGKTNRAIAEETALAFVAHGSQLNLLDSPIAAGTVRRTVPIQNSFAPGAREGSSRSR